MIAAAKTTFDEGFIGFLCIVWLLQAAIAFIVGIGDDRDSLVWLGSLMFGLYLAAKIGVARSWF